MTSRKASLCFFLFVLFFSFSVQASPPEKPIKIVASFSLIGDMIRQIGGDYVDLTVLVGPEQEVHGFQPAPQDAVFLADSEFIAINGLKLEGWMGRLINASGTKAKLLVVSSGIVPRIMDEEEGIIDPHAWQDLKNGELYARNIALALIEARPAFEKQIKERARAYIDEIKKLDEKTKAAFAAIPQKKRKVITNHDAFGYFGRAYGISFLAPVGISSQAEPAAADIAHLIEQIKKEDVTALFVESMASPRLMEQIAKDTGAHFGGMLYADTLSQAGGEAPTYLAMFRNNVKKMLEAIGSAEPR